MDLLASAKLCAWSSQSTESTRGGNSLEQRRFVAFWTRGSVFGASADRLFGFATASQAPSGGIAQLTQVSHAILKLVGATWPLQTASLVHKALCGADDHLNAFLSFVFRVLGFGPFGFGFCHREPGLRPSPSFFAPSVTVPSSVPFLFLF
eukprot:scaffold1430_cov257-Pinguiococcus_pyrenoidosus.AAC.12